MAKDVKKKRGRCWRALKRIKKLKKNLYRKSKLHPLGLPKEELKAQEIIKKL